MVHPSKESTVTGVAIGATVGCLLLVVIVVVAVVFWLRRRRSWDDQRPLASSAAAPDTATSMAYSPDDDSVVVVPPAGAEWDIDDHDRVRAQVGIDRYRLHFRRFQPVGTSCRYLSSKCIIR